MNIRRRTTEGFIIDFPMLNVLGFTSYVSPSQQSSLTYQLPGLVQRLAIFGRLTPGCHVMNGI
jgi:hypothetical protein